MKLAGFLLMPAGWAIVLTAVAMLPSGPAQAGFTLAGVTVEILGLGIVVRAFAIPPGDGA